MASLGTFYLLLPAPVLMGTTAYNNNKLNSLSRYHKHAFQLGVFYFVVFPVVILIMYFAGA
jgi:hypothetical protein